MQVKYLPARRMALIVGYRYRCSERPLRDLHLLLTRVAVTYLVAGDRIELSQPAYETGLLTVATPAVKSFTVLTCS